MRVTWVWILGGVVTLAAALMDAHAADLPADTLLARSAAKAAEGTHETRQQALELLDEATRRAPNRGDVWLALGKACIDRGQLQRGRTCLERAARLAPDDAETQYALGSAWKWEWLNSLERTSLVSAEQCLARAALLDPVPLQPWLELAGVALVRGNPKAAGVAALNAMRADSTAGEPLLALGCAAFRLGALGRADTAFRAAIERLSDAERARFLDIRWLDGRRRAAADSAAPRRIGSNPNGWSESDPDRTTPEDEAELDFMTRLGIALLVFRDGHGLRWDHRTELFVRYGPPGSIQLNPLDSRLRRQYSSPFIAREGKTARQLYGNEEFGYPYNVQVWHYPDLGMRVELWDHNLVQSFELPYQELRDAEPKPDPSALAARPDLVTLPGGRGVFRRLPPNVRPMVVRAMVSRFPSDRGGRLVAHVETAGGPADEMLGSWAVADARGRVLNRGSAPLAISACDPGGRRMVELSADVEPGEYQVDFAVNDPGGRRGLARTDVTVGTPSPGLALSDVVVLCGSTAMATQPDAVRVQPDFDRRSRGNAPLSVYFEIAGLKTAAAGGSRFSYRYIVRPLTAGDAGERAGDAVIDASREEIHSGGLRRQFVQVPVRGLKPGAYRLEIEVRDLLAGAVATGAARFGRE